MGQIVQSCPVAGVQSEDHSSVKDLGMQNRLSSFSLKIIN